MITTDPTGSSPTPGELIGLAEARTAAATRAHTATRAVLIAELGALIAARTRAAYPAAAELVVRAQWNGATSTATVDAVAASDGTELASDDLVATAAPADSLLFDRFRDLVEPDLARLAALDHQAAWIDTQRLFLVDLVDLEPARQRQHTEAEDVAEALATATQPTT